MQKRERKAPLKDNRGQDLKWKHRDCLAFGKRVFILRNSGWKEYFYFAAQAPKLRILVTNTPEF